MALSNYRIIQYNIWNIYIHTYIHTYIHIWNNQFFCFYAESFRNRHKFLQCRLLNFFVFKLNRGLNCYRKETCNQVSNCSVTVLYPYWNTGIVFDVFSHLHLSWIISVIRIYPHSKHQKTLVFGDDQWKPGILF